MLTYADWQAKFGTNPVIGAVTEPLYDLFIAEANIEMGTIVSRWLTQAHYDIAQGYFLCHLAVVSEGQGAGDAQPMAPLRTTDVDGVLVEFGISREMINNPQWLATTSYGQQYLRYRRMVFAGPRVV
jgi:hypothetical protein